MGRLAVDEAFTGQGLGGALLADALERAIRSGIAAYALMVDTKDGTASAWRITRPRGDPLPMKPTRHLPLRCRRSSPRQGQTQRDP